MSENVRALEKEQSRAAFDFRSDTVTTPTRRMLEAMVSSTLGDAVFNEDETTNKFEAHIAQLLGHEQGLFVPSGTAGNQIALRCHLTQPPHSVLAHHLSHIVTAEAGGLASLSQGTIQPVIPKIGPNLSLEDIQRNAILEEDIHYAPTRVIALENTLGGSVLPLGEAQRINGWAKQHGLKLHLDGARLWNAATEDPSLLMTYGKLFDSVSVCFSKGLGAPVGSVLVGSAPFIARAKWIRKSIGGGMRQTGTLTAAAWAALDDVFPGKLQQTHAIAKDIEAYIKTLGLKVSIPVETNMVFIDLKAAGLKNEWIAEEASQHGVTFGFAGRIVVHHQICPEAVEGLKAAIKAVVEKKAAGGYSDQDGIDGRESMYGGMKK
ncbi:hypothetical protein FS837_009712 [Tulasnella sp. UAMH 9824]|nr:hypothetical protein FS837_009712 [Tulasnella sp. UAMH 9824]